MKKEYLISMTAFVLANAWKASGWTRSDVQIRDNAFTIQIKYAKFLNQKNKLGFFVPCDENGNVLLIPKHWKDFESEKGFAINRECLEYKKAKERVLFKDSYFDTYGKLYCGGKFIGWQFSNERFNFNSELKTIEDVANSYKNIELTESAIKKIGLENG